MTIAILLIIGSIIGYYLFIKGWAYKILFVVFGWLGMYAFLAYNNFTQKALEINGHAISWAVLIPSILLFLLLITSKDE